MQLHTTTNILEIPELAAKCSVPFTPAEINPATGIITKPANAQCCTSDITLAEFKTLSGKMIPELKAAIVSMPFQGNFTQQDYAQKMIDEYKQGGVHPKNVYAQSFNSDDVLYWIQHEPAMAGRLSILTDSIMTQYSITLIPTLGNQAWRN